MIVSATEYNNQRFIDEQIGLDGLTASAFIDCEFKSCSFHGAKLRDCRFVDCEFLGSDLSLVEIPGSTFINVLFEDSKIIGVNWSRANWTLPLLMGRIRFSRSVLDHSTFLGLKLPGLKVTECVVWGADFREADLTGAVFSGSDLQDSIFGATDLTRADLSRARNYQIHPAKNTLTGAKFSLPEALSLLLSLDIRLVDWEITTEPD